MGDKKEKSIFELYPEEARKFREDFAATIRAHLEVRPIPPDLKKTDEPLYRALTRSRNVRTKPNYLPSVATLFKIGRFFHVDPYLLLKPRPKVAGSERRVHEHPAGEGVRKRTNKSRFRQ